MPALASNAGSLGMGNPSRMQPPKAGQNRSRRPSSVSGRGKIRKSGTGVIFAVIRLLTHA
jgi:hypothetical protein